MPKIYLSPSVQDFNPYIIGGNEEYYMNLIVDAMIPYLRTKQIEFERSNPGNTLTQVIRRSNDARCDLHIALHSNSSPENIRGMLRGPDVYYHASSVSGRKAAEIMTENLKKIYPDKDLVTAIPTTALAELKGTAAPTILIEIAYHDNFSDAQWIRNNINSIAKNIVLSLTEYFVIPFEDSE